MHLLESCLLFQHLKSQRAAPGFSRESIQDDFSLFMGPQGHTQDSSQASPEGFTQLLSSPENPVAAQGSSKESDLG